MASAPEQAALDAASTAAAAGAGSEADTTAAVDQSPLQLLEKAAANEATKTSSDVPTAPTRASAPSVLSDPGPLARLSRDPLQVCFTFLSLHDLATTHRVSLMWRAAHDAERTARWIFIQRIPRLIKRLAEELLQDDERFHLAAIKELRSLLCAERNPPIAPVLNTPGLLQRIVELVQKDEPNMQFEACWALTNMVCGSSAQCRQVVKAGVVPIFLRMIQDERASFAEARSQAVWASGAVPVILPLLVERPCPSLPASSDEQTQLLRHVAWTTNNLVRGKPQPEWSLISPLLPAVCKLIQTTEDSEVLTDLAWTLSYLSVDHTPGNERIGLLISAGVLPCVVELLGDPLPEIVTPALRTLGNVVTGNDDQTAAALAAGAVAALKPLLSHAEKGIKKEACWTLSNITAGNHEQIAQCIDSGCMGLIMEILLDKSTPNDVKQEAAWCMNNAITGGSVDQIVGFVNGGVFSVLSVILGMPSDAVVRGGIEALTSLLNVGTEQPPPDASSSDRNPFVSMARASCMPVLQSLRRQTSGNGDDAHDLSTLAPFFPEAGFAREDDTDSD